MIQGVASCLVVGVGVATGVTGAGVEAVTVQSALNIAPLGVVVGAGAIGVTGAGCCQTAGISQVAI